VTLRLPRLSALLALCLLAALLLLASCGIITINDVNRPQDSGETTAVTVPGTAPSQQTTAASPAVISPAQGPTAEELVASLPDADFEKVASLITCAVDTNRFTPENDDSPISEALLKRNRLVAEKLNTTVITQAADLSTIADAIRASTLSGTYYSELIAIPVSAVGTLQKSGLLMNLNILPHVDLSAQYFSQSAIRQLSYDNRVYAAAGSATAFSEDLFCLFINNTLARTLEIGNPASAVYYGEWTLDRFYMAVRSSTAVFGVYGFGYDIDREAMASAFFTASGGAFYSYDEKGRPLLNGAEESVIDRLRALYDDSYRYFHDDGKALNAFYDGKMLFYIDTLGKLPWFHDMSDDWGILPLPKSDAKQESYASLVSPSAAVIAVPAESSVSEKAGHFLQTLFAASHETIRDSYVDLLIEDYARENDSLNMADLIGKSAVYDFSAAFGSAYPAVSDAASSALDKALNENRSYADLIEQRRGALERALKSF